MLAITIRRERTGHWTRMRRSLARFSRSDASCRTPWLAGCITNTSGFKFLARTVVYAPLLPLFLLLFTGLYMFALPYATACSGRRTGLERATTRRAGEGASEGRNEPRRVGSLRAQYAEYLAAGPALQAERALTIT